MDRTIRKIIFILPHQISQIGLLPFADILKNEGFELEVWEIPSILQNPHSEMQLGDDPDYSFVKNIPRREDLIREIFHLNDDCLVNCFVRFSADSFFIYRALGKKKIPYCGLQMATLPHPRILKTEPQISPSHLARRILSLSWSDLRNHFFDRVILPHYSMFGIPAASIILLAGEKSLEKKIYPVDGNTKFLWAHTYDYDQYIKLKKEDGGSCQATGVFIDDGLSFHPDLVELGVHLPIPPDEYFAKLCRFFDEIERVFSIRIVIAAHPKSEYGQNSALFGGRKIIRGETGRLVREASLVITHMSTAVNYAVLFRKPIIFITLDELERLTTGRFIPGLYIGTMASALKQTLINIDHIPVLSNEQILKIDEAAYNSYRADYIKTDGSPELLFWEIFSRYCKRPDEVTG